MSELTTFKGHDILVLNPEAQHPFSFGKAKAKVIASNMNLIENFVAGDDLPAENISEYKGHKILVLNPGSYPLQFGLSKAQLILDNRDEILQFAEDV